MTVSVTFANASPHSAAVYYDKDGLTVVILVMLDFKVLLFLIAMLIIWRNLRR